jgi:putative ABC transport system permease protein
MNSALLGHYLLTLYRSLTRHRLYAALNALGLAVGVAVFLILWLDIRFETSFDRWIPGAANIYRLDQITTFPGRGLERDAMVSKVVAPLLQADYPQVVAMTRMGDDDEVMTVGRTIGAETVWFVDPDFFHVFNLPLVSGDKANALAAPGGIVVSARIARKYFGRTDVVGRQLTLSMNGTPVGYHVTGVLRDLPPNTHFKVDLLTPISPAIVALNSENYRNWNNVGGPSYVRFRSAADARAVQSDLLNFENRRASGADETKLGPHPTRILKLVLTPLTAVHFRDVGMNFTQEAGVDERTVASLAVVGSLTLVIAILNYVNLATARAALRAREVAMRKVLGSPRATLAIQFLGEAVAVTLLSVLIGAGLVELALPGINAASGSSLKLIWWGGESILPVLAGTTLLAGLAAGAYPAFLLSRLEPAPVLAASRMPGGGRFGGRLRGALVLLQFAAAICFTICTLVVGAQARLLRDADRGFQRYGLLLVDSMATPGLDKRQDAILDTLRGVAGVTRVTLSNDEPASHNIGLTEVSRLGGTSPGPQMMFQGVGADYLQTYGASLIAGRALDGEHRLDDIAGLHLQGAAVRGMNVMLNQTAVRMLGFVSPGQALGKSVKVNGQALATIVGVVRDVRFGSPRAPVGAIVYSYYSHDLPGGVAAVRYRGVPARQMTARLAAAWKTVVPEAPFVARTADARLAEYYLPDEHSARLLSMGAGSAVVLACVGLYGLATFTTARRVREIGVRKTLGASTEDVLRLIVGQFLRPVLLANLIAWPLAWVTMRSWLAGFDQRLALGPGYFLAATALTLIIALATVAGQAFAVARSEPAKALRHE